MTDASPKVGGFLPTSLKDTRNWSEWVLQENPEITQSSLKEYFCLNNTGSKEKIYHCGSRGLVTEWSCPIHCHDYLVAQELRFSNQASPVLCFSSLSLSSCLS